MSLNWIHEQTLGYYRGPACVGIIKGQSGWILIDSTVEAEAVKKIVKALANALPEFPSKEEAGRVSAVINTHAHADHCGGNSWLQKRYQTQVYASVQEVPYIETPSLEPHYLFSAQAPKPLFNKFFCAEASKVTHVIKWDEGNAKPQVGQVQTEIIDGVSLHLVRLPGHSIEMMGVITEDGYCFCGDLLFTPQILSKHPLLFLHDPANYMASLEWAASAAFNGVILTHGGYFDTHLDLVEATKARLSANAMLIESVMIGSKSDSEIHQAVSNALGLNEDLGGWHLNHAVIRSYLGQGLQEGRFSWSQGSYCIAAQASE